MFLKNFSNALFQTGIVEKLNFEDIQIQIQILNVT